MLRYALNKAADISPKVSDVLKTEFSIIDPSVDLMKYNDDFRLKNKLSSAHLLSALRAQKALDEASRECDKDMAKLLDMPDVAFDIAIDALKTLKRWRSPETEAFRKAAAAKWPAVTRLT